MVGVHDTQYLYANVTCVTFTILNSSIHFFRSNGRDADSVAVDGLADMVGLRSGIFDEIHMFAYAPPLEGSSTSASWLTHAYCAFLASLFFPCFD